MHLQQSNGLLRSDDQRHQPSDDWDPAFFQPLASTRRPSSNLPPLSYATATAQKTSPSDRRPQPTLRPAEIDRLNRTQVLRRLQHDTTPNSIIQQLTRQLGVAEPDLLEAVLRDPKDRRRFYITYRTTDMKQTAVRKGFYIGDIHIKPTDDTTDGYIPFPPYYVDQQTLDQLLRTYGELVSSSFIHTTHNTRVAGYKFSLKLKKGIQRPTFLEYANVGMDIKYTDDSKQCTFCQAFGHTTGTCRKRETDQLNRQKAREDARHAVDLSWYEAIRLIDEDSEKDFRELTAVYRHNVQLTADVYQEGLTTHQQAQATAATVAHWTTVYDNELARLKEIFDEDQAEFTSSNLESKKEATAVYKRAGGRPPHDHADQPMECDLDYLPDISAFDDPMVETVEDIRSHLSRGFKKLQAAATEAAKVPPKPPGVDASTPVEGAVSSGSQLPPPTSAPPPDPRGRHSSQSSSSSVGSTRVPPTFTSAHCSQIVAVTCADVPAFRTLVNDLLRNPVAFPDHSSDLNPKRVLLSTSTSDPGKSYLYVETAAMRDYLIEIVNNLHHKRSIVLTSAVTVFNNTNYIPYSGS